MGKMPFGLHRRGEWWHYRFELQGDLYRGTTKLRGMEDALAFCREYQRRIVLGEAKLLRETPTLRKVFEAWEERKRGVLSDKHLRTAKQYFNNHILPAMGNYSIGDIKNNMVEEHRNTYARTHSASSANGYLRYLKLVFKWAISQGYLKAMPWNVPLLKVELEQKAIVPADMEALFLDTARASCSFPIYCALSIGLKMGLRPGEVLRMTWDRVDLDGGVYLVTMTKAKRKRFVPIPVSLVEDLKALTRYEGVKWLFPSHDARIHHCESWLKKPVKRIGELIGLPGLSPHKLRASWATNMLLATSDPRSVQEVGGWASAEVMMKHYAQPNIERIREAMDNKGGAKSTGPIRKFKLVKRKVS